MECNISLSPEFIKQGMVLYVPDIQVADGNPHYWIILNKEIDVTDPVLYLIATSKSEKVEMYCRKVNPKMLNSLVRLEIEDEEFLTKKTILNCNEVKMIELRRLNGRDIKYISQLTNETINKVVIAVDCSVKVRVEYKKMIV
jgi:hypothetical protein